MKTSNILLVIFLTVAAWFYSQYIQSVVQDWNPITRLKS